MGFTIALIIAFLAFLNSQSSSPVDKSDAYQSNSNSYSNTERNTSQENLNRNDRINDDLFIPYNRLIYHDYKWEFSGNTTLIKTEDEEGYFLLIQTGKHQMNDENFYIQYTIESLYNSSGQKKMYFDHINVNNIPVEGKVTNKSTAASVLNDIANITKSAAFNEDAIGTRFLVDCAAVLLFNEININRGLSDYITMPKTPLNAFLMKAKGKLKIYMEEIEDLLTYESSNNTYNSSRQNFEIYLKVLEFDSVNSVKFDDIKVQYKKLAKKYHPDSITGDSNRFKLVTDSYEYLRENYPK